MPRHALNAMIIVVANTLLILAGVFMVMVAAGSSFTSSTLSYTRPRWPTHGGGDDASTQNTIIQYTLYVFGGVLIVSALSALVFLQRWWRRLDYSPVLFVVHAAVSGLAEMLSLSVLVCAILATVVASRDDGNGASASDAAAPAPAVAVSGGTANPTSRWAYVSIAAGALFLINAVAFFGAMAEHRAKVRQRRDLLVTEINASSPPDHHHHHTSSSSAYGGDISNAKWMARMSESHSAKLYPDEHYSHSATAGRRRPGGAAIPPPPPAAVVAGAGGGGGGIAAISLAAPSLSTGSSSVPGDGGGGGGKGAGGGGSVYSNYYPHDRWHAPSSYRAGRGGNGVPYPTFSSALQPYQQQHSLQHPYQQQSGFSHQSAPYGYPAATAAMATATAAASSSSLPPAVAASSAGGNRNSAYYSNAPNRRSYHLQPEWDYSAHYTEDFYPEYYTGADGTSLPPPPPSLLRHPPPIQMQTQQRGPQASNYQPSYHPPQESSSAPPQLERRETRNLYSPLPFLGPARGRDRGPGSAQAQTAEYEFRSPQTPSLPSPPPPPLTDDEYGGGGGGGVERDFHNPDDDADTHVDGVSPPPSRQPPLSRGGDGAGEFDGSSGYDFSDAETRHDEESFYEEGIAPRQSYKLYNADAVSFSDVGTTITTTTMRRQMEYEDTGSSVAGYAGSFYNSRRAGWVGTAAAGANTGGGNGSHPTVGTAVGPHVLLAALDHDQQQEHQPVRTSNVRYI
ncbi:hypothetical protein HDU86_002467 [Geranomyces michiganensis]|nr:hypothetical protein HDU86_002467 [Geranomyces michiganensis]